MIRWINNIKGIGILLVVLGHIIPRAELGQWIYAFHVPLFFYLSGYLLGIRPVGKWGVIPKVYRLMLPFYFWSFICLAINFVVAWIWMPEKIQELVRCTIHVVFGSGQNGLKEIGLSFFPLWFIPPLFFSNMIFIYGFKIIHNSVIRYVIFLILTITGCVLFYENRTLPFRVDISFIVVPIVLFGLFHDIIIRKVKKACFGFLLVIIGSFVNAINIRYSVVNSVEMVLQIVGNPLLFYVSSISLCMGMVVVVETIMRESSLVEFFGKNSMVVMVFHFPIIFLLNKTFSLDDISIFLITCTFLYILIVVINRVLPWSFNFKLLVKR